MHASRACIGQARTTAIVIAVIGVLSSGALAQDAGQIDDIPPPGPDPAYKHVSQFPEGTPMPVDGIWIASFNEKHFQIRNGVVFALQPYTNFLIFKVEPGDVVVKDVHATGPGVIEGWDLAALAAWKGTLQPDGTLKIEVKTLIPVHYVLKPVQPSNPEWFEQMMAAVAQGYSITRQPGQVQPSVPPPGYGGPPPPQPGYGAPPSPPARGNVTPMPAPAPGFRYPPGWGQPNN